MEIDRGQRKRGNTVLLSARFRIESWLYCLHITAVNMRAQDRAAAEAPPSAAASFVASAEGEP